MIRRQEATLWLCVVLLTVALRAQAAEGGPGGNGYAPGILGLLGRLHPFAVHFPIALTLVAAVTDLLYARTRQECFAFSVRYMLLVASLVGVLAVVFGFMAAAGAAYDRPLQGILNIHRVAGLIGAGMTFLATGLAFAAKGKEPWHYGLFRVVLVANVVMICLASFFGARLVHGIDHWKIF